MFNYVKLQVTWLKNTPWMYINVLLNFIEYISYNYIRVSSHVCASDLCFYFYFRLKKMLLFAHWYVAVVKFNIKTIKLHFCNCRSL